MIQASVLKSIGVVEDLTQLNLTGGFNHKRMLPFSLTSPRHHLSSPEIKN